MEDKSKTNGIGHNSKANEVAYYGQPPITQATLELVREALEAATKALGWAEWMQEKYAAAFKGEEPLTDDEKELNAKAVHYNKYILKNQDVFTKHKLRKLIKAKKLNLNQKHEYFHKAEEIYQDCWEEIFNAKNDLEQLLDKEGILNMVDEDEVKNVKKN